MPLGFKLVLRQKNKSTASPTDHITNNNVHLIHLRIDS